VIAGWKMERLAICLISPRKPLSRRLNLYPFRSELCFWSFAEQHAIVHSKKTQAEFDERIAILATSLPHADAIVRDALNCHRRRNVARDDVVDALVMLRAVIAPVPLPHSIPIIVKIDSHGLTMEIVYGGDLSMTADG